MTPHSFATIAAVLRAGSGLAIGPDKQYLLQTRLAPLLDAYKLRDLDALAAALHAGAAPALRRAVIEAMTTNETSFFRDAAPFAHIATHALARLHAVRPPGMRLRIWSAAASSGQEAFSLAIALAENQAAYRGREIEILGTDIARAPLARAQAGLYSPFEVQRGLPPHLLAKYFQPEGDQWRVNCDVRAVVRFHEWNLLDDLRPLGRFDIVLCRNVLIYFDPPTKKRVLAAIARQLAPDGLLYLGCAETISGSTDRFAPSADATGVYAPLATMQTVIIPPRIIPAHQSQAAAR